MTAESLNPKEVSRLLLDALDRPAHDRRSWLREAVDDAAVRDRIEALLNAHEAAERAGYLGTPIVRLRDPMIDRRIGPWRLLEHIGDGGMGTVYRAERADGAYRRVAAMKFLRHGGAATARRLQAECQILADLDHPNIARLYDSGIASDGSPYLALEYIDGDAITDYVRSHELKVADRLELFLQVCDAVAYAHHHLVVHCDLKPSNVMVVHGVAGPQVRLVDFGIAKVLASDDNIFQTKEAALTPAYAAPEQLMGRRITTTTDVYSLGVLLFELLTDKKPYDLTGKTAAQIERIVCEEIPPSPSRVRDTSGGLRRDIDLIAMTAMEKDPAFRYQGAAELADDVRRYMGGFPIRARPPRALYRSRRFVSRHKTAVASAAITLLALSLLIWNYTIRLKDALTLAESSAVEANLQLQRAEAVRGFLDRLLRAPNPRWYVDGEAKGPNTPIKLVLDEAAARIDSEFAGQLDIRADLHNIIGDTYQSLGLFDLATYHGNVVLQIRRQQYGADDPRLAEAFYYGGMFAPNATIRLQRLSESARLHGPHPEGNNYPFLMQGLAFDILAAGLPQPADSLLAEGYDYAVRHFVAGSPGERYRQVILTVIALERIRNKLALGDIDGARRWLASTDSLLATAPADGESMGARRNCYSGLLMVQSGDSTNAVESLQACYSDAIRPFNRFYAAPLLVTILEREGRPNEAEQYRADARRAVAYSDSMARAYREFRLSQE
ncbi:MAG: serine/threonine protein kinase [Bacteroidetes bacterium]|nr:serine/threonine protein kinase [Bacteroidota bacterium]